MVVCGAAVSVVSISSHAAGHDLYSLRQVMTMSEHIGSRRGETLGFGKHRFLYLLVCLTGHLNDIALIPSLITDEPIKPEKVG